MTAEHTCPACGTSVRPSASHCTWCGTALPLTDRTNQTAPASPAAETAVFDWSRKVEPVAQTTAPDPAAPAPASTAPAIVPLPGNRRSARSGRRAGLVGIAALAFLLVGAGTAAAFTVPIRTLKAGKPVEQMLPATTVLYASADLNPSGQNKTFLDAIVRDFTSQPGWARFEADFNRGTHGNNDSATCVDRTQHDAQTIFSQLGHRAAFALISARGFSFSASSAPATGSTATQSLERTAVALIPLDRSITLVQALSSSDFSLPQKSQSYAGTTIYQDTISSCQKANSSAPQTFYGALYNGYIVLALRPEPIERVIDTDRGKQPALASNATFKKLMGRMPADPLGLYYLDGKALLHSSLKGLPAYSGFSSGSYAGATQPSAGALTVDGQGFHLLTVTLSSAQPNTRAAGLLAGRLPASTLAFVSVQGLGKTIHSTVSQLEKSGLVSGSTRTSIDAVTADLTADMAGETDLVMLNPAGVASLNGNDTRSLPLALVWQIRDGGSANRHLDDLVLHQLGMSGQFSAHTAADGSSFRASPAGYGYAVHNHWAIVSLSVDQVLSTLSASPAGSLVASGAYRTAAVDARPSSTFYFDLHGLRLTLERAITPLVPGREVVSYNRDALPFLAPLKSLTGSVGGSHDGVVTSRMSVLIGPATETSARTH